MRLTNLNVNIENQIKENISGSFAKSVVKEHQRKSKSGKLSTVKQYTDKRQKKEKSHWDKLHKEQKKILNEAKPILENMHRSAVGGSDFMNAGRKLHELANKHLFNESTLTQKDQGKIQNIQHARSYLKEKIDSYSKSKKKEDLVDFGVKSMKEHTNDEEGNVYKEKKESKSDERKKIQDSIEFEDFDESDWNWLSGAERFKDGSSPVKFEPNDETFIVADKDGMQAFFLDEEGEDGGGVYHQYPSWVKTKDQAISYAKLMLSAVKRIDSSHLVTAGWKKL